MLGEGRMTSIQEQNCAAVRGGDSAAAELAGNEFLLSEPHFLIHCYWQVKEMFPQENVLVKPIPGHAGYGGTCRQLYACQGSFVALLWLLRIS